MSQKSTLWAALVAAIAFASGPAHGSITFTTAAGDSVGDGPVAATVEFTAVDGGLQIVLTNTETGTFSKGQAISAISFTLANGLTATYFTELSGLAYSPSSGVAWSTSSGLAFSDTSSSPPINGIDHWGFDTSAGSTQVLLATAGSPVPGSGNPSFMILPSSGTAGSGDALSKSGSNHFDPYIIGPATFDISALGVSSSTDLTDKSTLSSGWDITDVTVSFGTGPDSPSPFDTTGTNTPPVGGPAPSVPEPMSVVVWGFGAFCCGALALIRRRRNRV